MALIGILGGMGPLATVDFMAKVVQLTDASCDQQHLPMLVANLPHIPDRSRAILGDGEDCLGGLLEGIDLLNRNGVGLIAIPCNSAHHWYARIAARSAAPVLHIAEACVAAVPASARRVAVLGTGGTVKSGFYQAALTARDIEPLMPNADLQQSIAACIREVKAGALEQAAGHLSTVLDTLAAQDVRAAVMACTEIPVAARHLANAPLTLIDSSLELARATVAFAVARGWNRPQ
ncbi:amino acid racemase [Paraburkholderia phytofirmans]|uniref:aspartate/glutamate racemase family protein n=1 Tax=Paraburkholderia phytofirmans TaxID=261302 RepID=UPI0038BBD67E